jgi:hypothetical protein
MSSSIFNGSVVNQDIKFLNSHIGGENNDDKKIFKNQEKLNEEILNDDTTFKNKIKNKNDCFNNAPTVINSVSNLTNQLVIPEEYDSYIEYLEKKNLNNINSRVITNFNYINIDSSQDTANVNNNYINLQNNPLIISNNSNNLEIKIDNKNINNFSIGDKITIQGVVPTVKKNTNINFNFKNGSNIVTVNIDYDFSEVSRFFNILINFSEITNNGLDYFENMPINALNQTHNMYLVNNNTQIAFYLPIIFYSNNLSNLISSCKTTVYSIGNIPICNINANEPYGKLNLVSYQTISDKTKDSIFIKLPIKLNLKNNNNIQFGGNNVQIGKLINLSNNSYYEFICNFNIRYTNIASIRMISSEIAIPNINSDNIYINNFNNKFYWKNLTDYNKEYDITIPNGIYNYDTLLTKMTELLNSTKRITTNKYLYPYNNFILLFDSRINYFSFKSFNNYMLPKCFINFKKVDEYTYTIIISQINHLLTTLDQIEITKAIDYYTISKNDINTKQTVSNIISKDAYEITIKNINEIANVGDTGGGYATNIITKNSFSLLFNYENTVAPILKYENSGLSSSVTPFCDNMNDYTITNNQNYLFNNIQNNNTKNNNINDPNYSYFLLLCNGFNTCHNPFNTEYFYKFLLNSNTTLAVGILYDTFVNAPHYFNPPIKFLDYFKLTFVNPNGDPINYKTFKYSLTFEIITITNEIENTNINTNIAKI